VFGVMQNRYSPPSEWLKSVVEQGLLGEIYQVHIDCFWNRDDRYYHAGGWHGTKDLDGGTLFTQFSHFIDILYWVFGDVKPLNALLRNYNHSHSIAFEDSGLVHFALPQHRRSTRFAQLQHECVGYQSGEFHDGHWRQRVASRLPAST